MKYYLIMPEEMPRALVLDLSDSEGFGSSIVKVLTPMHSTMILSGNPKTGLIKEAMAEASVIAVAIDTSTNAHALQDFLTYIDHHRDLADSSLQLNIVFPGGDSAMFRDLIKLTPLDPGTYYLQDYLSFTEFAEKYKPRLRQASHMTQASS